MKKRKRKLIFPRIIFTILLLLLIVLSVKLVFSHEICKKNVPIIQEEDKKAFNELLESYDFDVSIYFHLIDADEIYIYRPTLNYYPASLVKAPMALYLYQKNDQGDIDLSWEDRALIEKMISYSDNDATDEIAYRFGLDRDSESYSEDYVYFLENIGVRYPRDFYMCGPGFISGEMNVMDMGCIMEALYQYFETETDNALELKSLFENYVYDLDLLETGTQLYKKYGRYDEACHDVAIGYEPQPFILCVMTNGGDEGEEMMDPDGIMQEISAFVVEHFFEE